MNLTVHGEDRRKAARAEARNGLQREEHIAARHLFLVQPEMLFQSLQDRLRFAHMAGGAVAYAQNVLAFGFQREAVIECRHAVYLARTDVQPSRQMHQHLRRQVLVMLLHILHHADQIFSLALVAVHDLIGQCEISIK